MMRMKSFSLGGLAQVLYILLSWIQLSEAEIVQKAVCKWDNSTSKCQQDQQGLIDLLTEAGQAHTFSLFMRCQYVSHKSQCNNLSKDTCIWENGACHISSKKLVTQINSCFFTSIAPCKNELVSISNSITWINQNSMNPASSCRQTVGNFSSTKTTCKLMQNALECQTRYQQSRRRNTHSECKWASSRQTNQAYQFISDLRYVMGVSKQDVSLKIQYLEENLGIKAGNLEEFFRCSSQDLLECEELPQKDKRGLSTAALLGILFGCFTFILFCCAFSIKAAISKRRQVQNVQQQQLQQQQQEVDATSQNSTQNQVTQIQLAEIIGELPHLEYTGAGENRSEQVCVICLEGLKEGEISTVLPCAHWFHKNCIESWINNKGSSVTCPLCNHPVQQQNNQL